MADESKLLTEAELQAIADGTYCVSDTQAEINFLLADIRRYRKWCRQMAETVNDPDGASMLEYLAPLVLAALDDK